MEDVLSQGEGGISKVGEDNRGTSFARYSLGQQPQRGAPDTGTVCSYGQTGVTQSLGGDGFWAKARATLKAPPSGRRPIEDFADGFRSAVALDAQLFLEIGGGAGVVPGVDSQTAERVDGARREVPVV